MICLIFFFKCLLPSCATLVFFFWKYVLKIDLMPLFILHNKFYQYKKIIHFTSFKFHHCLKNLHLFIGCSFSILPCAYLQHNRFDVIKCYYTFYFLFFRGIKVERHLRWKNLRDYFSKCLKIRGIKTRSRAEASSLSKWKLFAQIFLLKDSILSCLTACKVAGNSQSVSQCWVFFTSIK